MKTTLLKVTAWFLLVISARPTALSAAEENYHSLTLQQFADLVSEHSPDKAIDSKAVELAELAESRSGLLADPMVTVTRENEPAPSVWPSQDSAMNSPGQSPSWKWTVTQSIPWPGSLGAAERLAKATTTSARISQDTSDAERRFVAMKLFVEMVRKNFAIEIQKTVAADTNALLDIVRERYKQGTGSHMEALQSQIETIRLNASLASQRAELDNLKSHAELLLSGVRGVPVHADFKLEWPKDWLNSSPISDAGQRDYTRDLIDNSQELGAANRELAYKKSLPALNLGIMAMQNDDGMHSVGAMLGIQIPIYSFAERHALSLENDAFHTKTDLDMTWYVRRKKLSEDQTKIRIRQIAENLATLEREILPLIREHLTSATVSYGEGKGSVSSIIESRRELLNFEMSRIDISAELVRAHIALSEIAAGFADRLIDIPIPNLAASGMGGGPLNGDSMNGPSMSGSTGDRMPGDKSEMMKKSPTRPPSSPPIEPEGKGMGM